MARLVNSRPFKVCDADRKKQIGVTAITIDDVKTKVKKYFGIEEQLTIVEESDGTMLEDDEYFDTLPNYMLLMALKEGEQWIPRQGVQLVSTHETDQTDSLENELDAVARSIRENPARIPLLRKHELERSKVPREALVHFPADEGLSIVKTSLIKGDICNGAEVEVQWEGDILPATIRHLSNNPHKLLQMQRDLLKASHEEDDLDLPSTSTQCIQPVTSPPRIPKKRKAKEIPRVFVQVEPAGEDSLAISQANTCLYETPKHFYQMSELEESICRHFDAKFEAFRFEIRDVISNLMVKLNGMTLAEPMAPTADQQDEPPQQPHQLPMPLPPVHLPVPVCVDPPNDLDHRFDENQLLPNETIAEVHRWATSPRNFSLGLVRKLFTKEEMRPSNVNGKQGHPKLDPEKIGFVKDTVIRLYSIPVSEQTRTWKNCIISIDEGCRRLRRLHQQQQQQQQQHHHHQQQQPDQQD